MAIGEIVLRCDRNSASCAGEISSQIENDIQSIKHITGRQESGGRVLNMRREQMSDWFLDEPGTSDVSQFLTGDSQPNTASQSLRALTDSRNAERYNVHWKMAVVFENQENKPTYHGYTHDLSLVGTGMLTHVNLLKPALPVIILLAPPPLTLKDRPKIIEIRSRQLDAVYSGETRCFRLGFAFVEFKNDGLDLLTERLKHHKSVAKMSMTKPIL